MKLLFTLALWLFGMCLYAQDDIIYLKDGTIYQGSITEYVPQKRASIKLLDDRIVVVPAENIAHMSIGKDDIIKKNFDIKEKGFYHNSLLGTQWGKSETSSTQITFAYNMVNGYRIKKHHLGLGLGLEKHVGNWYIPIYADYSYHILKGHFSPVIGVNGGFMPPFRNDLQGEFGYSEGAFVGGRVGIVAYGNPHFALLVNITYRHIFLYGAEINRFPNWNEVHHVTGSARLNRVGVTVGFVLN